MEFVTLSMTFLTFLLNISWTVFEQLFWWFFYAFDFSELLDRSSFDLVFLSDLKKLVCIDLHRFAENVKCELEWKSPDGRESAVLLRSLRGHSLLTLTRFWPFFDQIYTPGYHLWRNYFTVIRENPLTFPVPPTYLVLST